MTISNNRFLGYAIAYYVMNSALWLVLIFKYKEIIVLPVKLISPLLWLLLPWIAQNLVWVVYYFQRRWGHTSTIVLEIVDFVVHLTWALLGIFSFDYHQEYFAYPVVMLFMTVCHCMAAIITLILDRSRDNHHYYYQVA